MLLHSAQICPRLVNGKRQMTESLNNLLSLLNLHISRLRRAYTALEKNCWQGGLTICVGGFAKLAITPKQFYILTLVQQIQFQLLSEASTFAASSCGQYSAIICVWEENANIERFQIIDTLELTMSNV